MEFGSGSLCGIVNIIKIHRIVQAKGLEDNIISAFSKQKRKPSDTDSMGNYWIHLLSGVFNGFS